MNNGAIRVLICPLNWGIGHATRCVPVIRALLRTGCEVIIASEGRPLAFLRKEFPELSAVHFPGTPVTYPKSRHFTCFFLLRIPRLIAGIIHDYRQLRIIVRQYDISLVISDNRFGCWHSSIPSVFITHQLRIRLPKTIRLLTGLLQYINYRIIHQYTECWIPDFETHAVLAGELSHPARLPRNSFYIGALSRFSKNDLSATSLPLLYNVICILSGPEPQRSILEKILMEQLLRSPLSAAVIRGLTESEEADIIDEHIFLFSHAGTNRLRKLIEQSEVVICRSGYSGIMDLAATGKRAILIPTPGQTEQEYLADYLMRKKIFFAQKQNEFDLLLAIDMVKNYPGMAAENNYSLLYERIINMIPATMKGKLSH